ncbi:MAG: hypothetical protein KKF67_02990 [Nanoarchaeota archaeon]|nr:hypothetical protein [Nanoarchaeota archaeon]
MEKVKIIKTSPETLQRIKKEGRRIVWKAGIEKFTLFLEPKKALIKTVEKTAKKLGADYIIYRELIDITNIYLRGCYGEFEFYR